MDDFDLYIFHFKVDIILFFGRFLRFEFSQQPCHGFAYQWLNKF